MSNLKIISIKEGVAPSTGKPFVAVSCVQEQYLFISYGKTSDGKNDYARKADLFDEIEQKEGEKLVFQQGGSFCSFFLKGEEIGLAKALAVNETLHLSNPQFERNTQGDQNYLNVRGELLLSATQTLRLFKSMNGNNVQQNSESKTVVEPKPKQRKPKMAAASMTTEVKEESVEVAIDEKIPF